MLPSQVRRSPYGVLLALVVLVTGLLLSVGPSLRPADAATVTLMSSTHADRSAAQPLSATPQSGLLYIFTSPDAGVSQVSFWLDDPNRTRAATHVETWAPFTFAGDTAAGSNPWDSTKVPNGAHTITAAVVSGTTTTVISSTFQVANGVVPPPTPQPSPYALAVSTHADRSSSVALAGATLSGAAYVFVPASAAISKVSFFLDDPTRSKAPYQVETWAPLDLRGTAASGAANPWSTTALPDGTHVISADITTTTGVSSIDAAFTVKNAAPPTTAPPTTAPPTTAPPTTAPPTTAPPTTAPPTTAPPTPPGGPAALPTFSYAPIAAMPIGTTEAESEVLNNQLYMFGGFDVKQVCCTPTDRAWRYDVAANTWTALPTMPAHGISHAGMDSDGSRYIYYAGGYAASATGIDHVDATALAWRYDIVTGTYTALPNLPQPRTAGGLSYISGKLYYLGGNGLDRTVDSTQMWMLDVASNATSWVDVAGMPNPRDHVGWATEGGQIYAVGGEHGTDANKAQAELDRYDPATNAWTVLAPMPFARSHLMDTTFFMGGELYAISGWTTTAVSGAVIAYDPATNTWRATTSVPEARTSATSDPVSGGRFLYCCGSASSSTATGWIATPTA